MTKKNGVQIDHMRISVSYQCNLHCEHCYVPEEFRTKYRQVLGDKELSLDQIRGFIDYLIESHGLKKISVTGGEALIRSVWPRTKAVLEHANLRGLSVQLNTGGLGQIPIPDIVRLFDDPTKLMLQISLDGARAETVDRFRGHRGVFDSALRQMAEVTRAGSQIQVRYTINESNYDETLETYELVAAIPVHSFKVKPMFAAGTALDNQDRLIRAQERIAGLQRALIELSSRVPTHLEIAPPVLVDAAEFSQHTNFTLPGCTCGVSSGYLSSSGDLYACSYGIGDSHSDDLVVGNITTEGFDFAHAWSTAGKLQVFRDREGVHHCPSEGLMLARNVEPMSIEPMEAATSAE